MGNKEKIKDLGVIQCPHCKEFVEVKQKRTVLQKAVQGEYEDELIVGKPSQKQINDY